MKRSDELLPPDAARRRTLGAFLRAQRDRLTPAEMGLPAGVRRRAPGLRREELAQLCGMSATWYSWIEQGREVSVSPGALARLAQALRLSRAERDYVFALAGRLDPVSPPVHLADPPAALVAAVDLFAGPAYVIDRSWTARAWNPPATRLFVGWLDEGPDAVESGRSLLRYVFLAPSSRRLIRDWPERARRLLAEFRADCSARLNEPPIKALVEDLAGRSSFFANCWGEHAVTGREGGARDFDHPEDGRLSYEQTTLNPANRPDLKLVLLVRNAAAPPPIAPGAASG
jgi:transcriptional regulator with XRE-family HTH domain